MANATASCRVGGCCCCFAELRDAIFDGHKAPLLELMDDDALLFEINDSNSLGVSWEAKFHGRAAQNRTFRYIARDGSLKERFLKLEKRSIGYMTEIRALEERKAAILSTMELER
eukprot:scaffold26441_cov142-Cylindrotheca_fusiformis.AAC.1